jgi:hypothetical protein
MTSTRPGAAVAGLLAALALSMALPVARVGVAAQSLPTRLSDQEFWRLSTGLSEADGFFRSDNLLSNEWRLQHVVPDLVRLAAPGRVYLGVGPEQNFTYMVATRPAMAFVVDIRRGNLDLQLMYKALFELSADRADFVSRLFAKKRPAGLSATSTAREIFAAYDAVPRTDAMYFDNLRAIVALLRDGHGFALSADDVRGIEYASHAFYFYGLGLQYASTGAGGGIGFGSQPTYVDLMTATDQMGVARGYLATEDNFRFMKDLESRNLVVPVIGNFGGPKAIRAIGQYLKDSGGLVSAFYLSNVEQYLRQDGILTAFCENAARLPLDDSSVFIRSIRRVAGNGPGLGLSSELGNMKAELRDCR